MPTGGIKKQLQKEKQIFACIGFTDMRKFSILVHKQQPDVPFDSI